MGVRNPQNVGNMGVFGRVGNKSAEKVIDLREQLDGLRLATEFSVHPVGELLGAFAITFLAKVQNFLGPLLVCLAASFLKGHDDAHDEDEARRRSQISKCNSINERQSVSTRADSARHQRRHPAGSVPVEVTVAEMTGVTMTPPSPGLGHSLRLGMTCWR
jgi:hypothetical protein